MRNFDLESTEQYILSAVLNDHKAIHVIAYELKREDFSIEKNKDVFDAMIALKTENTYVDIISVESKLKMNGKEWLVKEEYIKELYEKVASAAEIEHWIGQLKESSNLRKLRVILSSLLNLINESTYTANEVIDKAFKQLNEIAFSQRENDFRNAFEIKQEFMNNLKDGKSLGYTTGFTQLDYYMPKGLKNKQMIVLAAPTSVGKTTFALNLARNLISKEKKVAIISMEMDAKELWMRMICSMAQINSDSFVSMKFDDSKTERLHQAINEPLFSNLNILDSTDLSIEQIMRKCEFWKLKNGLDFLIIDYINLIRIENQNRTVGIGEVSRKLKVMAGILDIPILVLSQMNREAVKNGGEADLHNLRDSGCVEQDADIVWIITRKNKTDREAKFKIAKNRNGQTGDFTLEFIGEYFLFQDSTTNNLKGGSL